MKVMDVRFFLVFFSCQKQIFMKQQHCGFLIRAERLTQSYVVICNALYGYDALFVY